MARHGTPSRLANPVKEAAQGRWPDILNKLGIAVPPQPTQHGPCPTCGGKDRFRFDNQNGHGTWFCNQCSPKAGDGFALVMNTLKLNFKEATKRVASILGISADVPRTIEKVYPYRNADGQLVFEVVRYKPKAFLQRRPDGHGGYINNIKGIDRVLYRLPEVMAAQSVLVLEGEKDVATAYAFGLPNTWAATTNPMGAGKGAEKWKPSYSESLRGKHVTLCPDTDESGQRHGHYIASDLRGIAASVRWLRLPEGFKDLSEWAEGKQKEDFYQFMAGATLYEAEESHEAETPDTLPWTNSLELIRTKPPETAWLIEGLIPENAVVLFSGREGAMKTWLAMDWAFALAEGKPWLGRQAEAGAVLYVDAEMPGNLTRSRLYECGTSLNLNVLHWQEAQFPEEPYELDHPILLQGAKAHRLIVIDTLRRFMENKDENSATDMATITTKLRGLTRWGASVLVLHHGLKDPERGGYRGSTELGAAVDVSMTIVKKVENGSEILTINAPKSRYSANPSLILKVEKTPTRPKFIDMTGMVKAAKATSKAADFVKLAEVIAKLRTTQGQDPSQSEVVTAAGEAGCGCRATVLQRLTDGEPTYWKSEANGKTKVYRHPDLSTCLPSPQGGVLDKLDRSLSPVCSVYHPLEQTTRQGTNPDHLATTKRQEDGLNDQDYLDLDAVNL